MRILATPRKIRRGLRELPSYAVIFVTVGVWVFPLLWLIVCSFRPSDLIHSKNLILLFQPTLENYRQVFLTQNFARYLFNSTLVAVSVGLLTVAVGTIAAYSMVRFGGGRTVAFLTLVSRMMPPAVMTVPMFIIFSRAGLINNPQALIIANTALNLSLAVWLMRGYLEDLPEEIEEAALIDGASRLQALYKVVLPMATPGIIVTTALVVIFTWNEFMFASIFAFSPTAKTLPIAAADFITAYATLWGPMFAAGVAIVTPVMLFVLFLQRYLVRGLTFGAVR